MKELKRDLLTNKFTRIYHEDEADQKYNAPHHFTVESVDGKYKECIDFQEGPCLECGVNGCANEDLINMIIERLKHFQKTDYKCRENAVAITKLEEALLWLRKRTMGREQRNVDGTSKV